jgi:hypothetical protein
MTISLSSPNSSTASIQKNGGDVITFDANNNATFAGNIVTTGTVVSGSAMGMRNRIINGDMRIDQRNAGASLTPTTDGQYTLDRFQVYISQSSKFSVQQNAGSVTPPAGFNYYAGITSLSAYTVGSSDYFCFVQNVEGYNIGDFAWGTASAKTVTLSFWVRSSLTGTFGGSIRNGSANYSFPFNYTISSANTWEQKTVTITAPTAGTWTTTNTSGLQVIFGLGVGSTNSGTTNAWTGSSVLSATSAVSVVGTNGATFYITGVQLEVGSTATSFEWRHYGTELALCQRYYENSYDTGTAVATNIGNDSQSRHTIAVVSNSKAWSIGTPYKVKKRTNPSVTLYNRAGTSGQWFWGAYGVNEASSSTIIAASCQNELQAIYTSSYPAGTNGGYGHFSADAEL